MVIYSLKIKVIWIVIGRWKKYYETLTGTFIINN